MNTLKITYKTLLFVLLGANAHNSWADFYDQEDIPAPNTDVFLEFMLGQSDLESLIDDSSTAGQLRLGFQLNDIKTASITWGLEGSVFLLGNVSDDNQVVSDISFSDPDFETLIEQNENSVAINGFEIGGRASLANSLYARGGLFLNTIKNKIKTVEVRIDEDNVLADEIIIRPSRSNSETKISPYLGIGWLWQVDEKSGIFLEYNNHRVDNENIGTAGAGFRFVF